MEFPVICILMPFSQSPQQLECAEGRGGIMERPQRWTVGTLKWGRSLQGRQGDWVARRSSGLRGLLPPLHTFLPADLAPTHA